MEGKFKTALTLALIAAASFNPLATIAGTLDLYEVTNAEYRRFVESTRHPPPQYWYGEAYPEGQGNEPVVLVTWYDAAAYCKWAGNKRLPTVQEWRASCGAAEFGKLGDVWEWTSTEVEGERDKVLCGPQGTCECTHMYHPTWKNMVKGFRCAGNQPLVLK
jgi:formylglycine-generating enzyme required for sulfatase activity